MRPSVVLASFVGIIAAVTGLAIAYSNTNPSSTDPLRFEVGKPQVKLAVLVVFDQMRGDYLETYRGLFGADGFARLQSEGAWFTNCYYPYATTTTGPGHSSMLTGTCGDRHGIINNQWYENGAVVNCAESTRYELVPTPDPPPPDPKAKNTKPKPPEGGFPERLLAETVADVLRESHPSSRIFGLSLKDRSAVLPVGKKPNGSYWFVNGSFVTSTYYAGRAHPWVEAYNALRAPGKEGANNTKLEGANKWFGKPWTPVREDINYYDWLEPSIAHTEFAINHKEKLEPKPGPKYYGQLVNSPFGNELLLEFAKICANAEQLGKHETPDLLVVSFSSNDIVGHTDGPDSREVMDVTIRSDAIMASLLAFLDSQVGKGQYLVAVTADHGICPVVEVSQQVYKDRKVYDPARVNLKTMQTAIEAHLNAHFGSTGDTKASDPKTGEKEKKSGWVEAFGTPLTFPWLYFNQKLLKAAGKSREEAARTTAEFLMTLPHVERAFTREDLAREMPASDAIGQRVRRSFHPDRAGDIYVLLKPYCLAAEGPLANKGTNHGTPYNYDVHVPLLVYGPGIRGGARAEPTTPQATAAIFSKWLGLRLPNKAEFFVPATLLSD